MALDLVVVVYMTLQDHVIKVSGDFLEKRIIVYLHPTQIHSHSVDGFVIVLVCHVILQNHLMIWSCDFMSSSH